MAKSKTTITRDSVFKHITTQKSQQKNIVRQGLQEEEKTLQTAVWLSEKELEWIDTQGREIKKNGWRSFTRSAYIRALIKADMKKHTSVSGVSGESELTEKLASK